MIYIYTYVVIRRRVYKVVLCIISRNFEQGIDHVLMSWVGLIGIIITCLWGGGVFVHSCHFILYMCVRNNICIYVTYIVYVERTRVFHWLRLGNITYIFRVPIYIIWMGVDGEGGEISGCKLTPQYTVFKISAQEWQTSLPPKYLQNILELGGKNVIPLLFEKHMQFVVMVKLESRP